MATFLERKREERESSLGQQTSIGKEFLENLKGQWASDDEQNEANREEAYRKALADEENRLASIYIASVELAASNDINKLLQAVAGFETVIDLNDSKEQAALCREKIDAILLDEHKKVVSELKEVRSKYKLCQRCGSKLGNAKVCPKCGEPKDN